MSTLNEMPYVFGDFGPDTIGQIMLWARTYREQNGHPEDHPVVVKVSLEVYSALWVEGLIDDRGRLSAAIVHPQPNVRIESRSGGSS